MSDPARPVLEMHDGAVTSLHTPGNILIDQVEWTVHTGETWVVGGLPGSGKSDLLATAAGLLRPARGTVFLFGKDVASLGEEERLRVQLRVGMVFGYGGRLFTGLTIAQNLGLPFCYHHNCAPDASEARIAAVLELMGLMTVAHQTPLLINRNLRQRVALARALVLSPELLFLDNPLAGLDPRESRWWVEFLDGLRRPHPVLENRTLTLVVATDDVQPWSGRQRKYAFIDRQRLVEVGSPADLARLHTPALRDLVPTAWLEG